MSNAAGDASHSGICRHPDGGSMARICKSRADGPGLAQSEGAPDRRRL